MLIAHRNGMTVKGGWVNPYVTNGLVAMWDGEWNAGGSVHDSAATTWVDLSGTGNDLTVSSPAYFADNSFHVNRASPAAITNNPIGGIPLTLEFCGIEPNNDAGLTFGWINVNRFVCHRATYIENFGNNGPGFHVDNGELFSGGEIYDSESTVSGTVFKNGEIVSSTIGANFSAFNFDGFGARYDFKSSAIVKCLRLYNRRLTSAEIAHNYAVDKARFNLP